MNRICRYTCCILFCSIIFFIPFVRCAYDLSPFHSKTEKIAMWKELWNNQYGTQYYSAGKTYTGQDILVFEIGNPAGGKVLWDAEMHGGEDKGSEILFLIAKWLLESGDPIALQILNENCIYFIPQVNDQNTRGNGNLEINPNGVDLNRNFHTGWAYTQPGSDQFCFAGTSPGSEPETKTMRNIFSTIQPIFYVNLHCGAGPYAAYSNEGNITLSEQVTSKAQKIATNLNITSYPIRRSGSNGFAIGDAVFLGVKSAWLIECVDEATGGLHRPEDYTELVNIYYPKCLALFIAMCELSATNQTQPPDTNLPIDGNSNPLVPEFPSYVLPIVLVVSTVFAVFYRKKLQNRAPLV